jgi:hypothetical protein
MTSRQAHVTNQGHSPMPAPHRLFGLLAVLGVSLVAILAVLSFGFLLIAPSPAFAKETHLFEGTIGSGELTHPDELAADIANDDLYVGDEETERYSVHRFNAKGEPEAFSGLGSNVFGPVEFSPSGQRKENFAVAGSGNLYVASEGRGLLAFDSSGEPAPFSASAPYIEGNAITGTPGNPALYDIKQTVRVAVDSNGAIYVEEPRHKEIISIYAPSGQYLTQLMIPPDSHENSVEAMAIGAGGALYVIQGNSILRYTPTSFPVTPTTSYGPPATFYSAPEQNLQHFLAANSAGDLYVALGSSSVIELNEAGAKVSESAASEPGHIKEPRGVAVAGSGGSERFYLTAAGEGRNRVVQAFGPLVTVPDATTTQVTEVTNTTAQISGTVDPAGTEAFAQAEYGSGSSEFSPYGHKAPAAPLAVGSDEADHPVSIELTGLEPSTAYHVRIDGIDHCESGEPAKECVSPGRDLSFHTIGPPAVQGPRVSSLSGVGATVAAEVNPSGYATTYEVQYGPTSAYGSDSAPQTIGPVDEVQSLQINHATEGQFRLGFLGETTGDLSFGAAAATVQAALRSLPVIGAQGVSVSGSGTEISPYLFTFEGPLADENVPPLEVQPGATPLNGGAEVGTDTDGGLAGTQQVTGVLTRLSPETEYHYRVLATSHCNPAEPSELCTVASPDATLTTGPPLRIDSTSVTGVTGAEATLLAQIDPEGTATTAHFEYLTEAQFEEDGETFGAGAEKTLESASIGSDSKDHQASATIAGLTPGTTYDYRVVAANGANSAAAAGIDGPVQLLRTYSTAPASSECANEQLRIENNSIALPDCRAWELVSPADAGGEVYAPVQGVDGAPLVSEVPSRAAAGGEGVVYVADPPVLGGNGAQGEGLGDQWLAGRAPSGWTANVLTPSIAPVATNEEGYQAFSADLSRGVFYSFGTDSSNVIPSLAPGAPPDCRVLYSHAGADADSGFQPLFSETQETGKTRENCGVPFFAGASADYSHLFFQTEAALLPGVKSGTNPSGNNPLNQEERCLSGCDLYASVDGQTTLVSRLPSGAQVGGATFGAPGLLPLERPDFGQAVSADGSRAFWTDTSTGKIYVREGVGTPEAKTVQVSAGKAQYWTATPDGRYAYYTENGALFRFDLQAEPGHQRETLAPAGAGVQGVIGVNETGEDGSYLYFVAAGKLSPQAEARACEVGEAVAEEDGHLPVGYGCNLYLLHGGETKFIAALSAQDDNFTDPATRGAVGLLAGVWRPDLSSRLAQLTPDGHSLVFQSVLHLTDADADVPVASVFDYDAEAGLLSCVSCNPSGADAQAEVALRGRGATSLSLSPMPTYMERWISADGSRVFFQTTQALTVQDTNGLQDVYEWQRQGSAGCPASSASPFTGGCLRLLSDGAGQNPSWFLEASAGGDDVFLITRDQLTPAARNGQLRVFDARVDGGFPASTGAMVQPPSCESGEACLPPPNEHPVESFPGSAAFSGAGNLLVSPPIEKSATKPPPKLTNAQKLAAALKTCRKDRSKKKRVKCETSAHEKYSPKPKKKAKKSMKKKAKQSSHNGRTR